MDQSSAYLQQDETINLLRSLGLGEEEVIYESRRKRQRIGRSPPHPRGIIPPLPTVDVAPVQGTQRQAEHSLLRTSGREAPGTSASGRMSLERIRSSLYESMNELETVVKKIRNLTRMLEGESNQDNRQGRNFPVIQQKLQELNSLLSAELGHSSRRGKRVDSDTTPGTSSASLTRRPQNDTLFNSISHHDKRKRSRTVISLKKTSETMDIDMDP